MGNQATQLFPFAYGTTRKPVPIATVPFVAGGQIQPIRIPKSGFLSRLKFNFVGHVTLGTTAGSGPIPLWNLIQNYTLQNAVGYQYRNLDGDSWYFANQLSTRNGFDAVTGSPSFEGAYGVATIIPVAFELTDYIGMNQGINFDKFLISAQNQNSDLYIQMQWAAITAIGGSVSAVDGTLYVTAEYLTVPDVTKFALPDTATVQQILADPGYVNVVAGQNYVNLTPIQGPEYLGVGLKIVTNATADPATFATNLLNVQLFVNGTDPIMNWSAQDIIDEQFRHFGRMLPAGWFYLNFSDDISLVNAMGPVERLALATTAYSQVNLLTTLAAGTNVTAPSSIKLLKRLQSVVATS